MEDIKISVIIPVYKVEPYLKRCVDSVRAQTYKNLEIILVDDGSPDNCGAMCDEYAGEDARIRVIHKENGGLSDARNAGLDVATGDYIGFVDSDDWIEPEMYEVLLKLAREKDADIASCEIARARPGVDGYTYSENAWGGVVVLNRSEALGDLVDNTRLHNYPWNKLYVRAIFDSICFHVGIAFEDVDIMHQLLNRANRVVYTNQALYVNYLSPGSITRSGFTMKQFDAIDSYRRRAEFYREFCPQHCENARLQYVEKANGNLEWAMSAPELREVRRRYCQQLSNDLRRHPQLILKCQGKLKKKAFYYLLGPSAHDFLLRASSGIKRRWRRLKRRLLRR